MSSLINDGGVNVHGFPIWATWNIRAIRDGEVVQEETKENLIVDNGRADLLNLIFGLGASSVMTTLGVGACSTAATHTDSRLNYEYCVTASTPTSDRYPLTNTSGALLTSADVQTISQTDGLGNNYYRQIIVQATVPTSDPNVNQPFQEYGLFSNVATPATPTSTSGTMFNHLVAASPIIKDSSTQIVVQVTLRV